jgi:glycosyltransferase involved in cell wall biosynthesis
MTPWLLVAGDFTPLGGMDRANYALASYLARKAGAEVHLVTHRAWSDLRALPGVTVHPVVRPWGKHTLGAPLLDRAGRRLVRRLGRNTRVVVNGGNCLWGDVNWVHYVHAAWERRTLGGLPQRIRTALADRLDRTAERAALAQARVVVANSEQTRIDLLERLGLPPERVHTVYYGIDPERFRPPTPSEHALARARFGWDDDRPTLAFVGALGDLRKGFDILFEAWLQLAQGSGWDARLAIVGSGATLAYWMRQAQSFGLGGSVEFLGFREDVPEVLRACDALVSPTRYEAYGLNVHEALCCGLPAFVSCSAGVAERYPVELGNYLIPDPNDPADLAARLARWRDQISTGADTPALSALCDRLRAWTWDDMAEQFVAVVQGQG